MELEKNYIRGELWQPVAVELTEPVTKPEAVLSETEVTFHLTGQVLYAGTLDHQISQIVFQGKEHTYIYDTTDIVLSDP